MGDTTMHGLLSEMTKVGNPYKNGVFGRESYYTSVSFTIQDTVLDVTAKVDTGATYTIFGLNNSMFSELAEQIQNSTMRGRAYDASDTELRLYGYVVNDFRLTDDIVIDRIKLFFSADIGDKALLGMDILSLFDFQYLREKHQNYGTFWINNYHEVLKELHTRKLNKGIDYIDPILIANIEPR